MTPLDMIRLRLANQQIAVHAGQTPQDVVAALGAMQAQDYRGALWAVGLRLPGTRAADVERAAADAAIVRTWAVRGTLHFVASADVRWLLGLLAPRIMARGAGRRRQLQIDGSTLVRSADLLTDALSHKGRLGRDEVMGRLDAGGVETAGQRGIHILRHLSLEGLLCQAGMKGKQIAFVLLDDWVPQTQPMDREAALAELAARYFGSHGPATLRDFAWWSGQTKADAATGIELARPRLESDTVGEVTYRTAVGAPAARAVEQRVRVLPSFDEYLLGYADRGLVLDGAASERVAPGGNGLFRPIVVANGRVVGTWRPGNGTRASSILELIDRLDDTGSRSLAKALGDYDDFVKPSA